MVCAAKGYPLVMTMAESFSIERRKFILTEPSNAQIIGSGRS